MQWVNLEDGAVRKIRKYQQPVFVYKHTKNAASLLCAPVSALIAMLKKKWLKVQTFWKQLPVPINVFFYSFVLWKKKKKASIY